VWEWQVRAGRVSALFFPAPTVIGRTLARWVITGDLTPHLSATLLRVGVGFVVGGAGGLLLGLLMGWSRRVRVVIDPLIAAVHPVPKIAILPLIMILFGIGETSKIVVVVIAAFFPMLINTMAGVRQIQPLYFEVAANYGARPVQVFARVIIPGSLPLILTGMRLALNSALLITIAVELVTAQQGLGALVWLAWETLRTEELYASLAVTAALGMSFNVLLHYLTTVLVPWRTEESHP
jgi:ABC-type nitrate/sulfonate/bicarbonate transport system permease component